MMASNQIRPPQADKDSDHEVYKQVQYLANSWMDKWKSSGSDTDGQESTYAASSEAKDLLVRNQAMEHLVHAKVARSLIRLEVDLRKAWVHKYLRNSHFGVWQHILLQEDKVKKLTDEISISETMLSQWDDRVAREKVEKEAREAEKNIRELLKSEGERKIALDSLEKHGEGIFVDLDTLIINPVQKPDIDDDEDMSDSDVGSYESDLTGERRFPPYPTRDPRALRYFESRLSKDKPDLDVLRHMARFSNQDAYDLIELSFEDIHRRLMSGDEAVELSPVKSARSQRQQSVYTGEPDPDAVEEYKDRKNFVSENELKRLKTKKRMPKREGEPSTKTLG